MVLWIHFWYGSMGKGGGKGWTLDLWPSSFAFLCFQQGLHGFLHNDQIWNCSKYRERTAGVAATVNTQDKDDKVESIYATQRCWDQAPCEIVQISFLRKGNNSDYLSADFVGFNFTMGIQDWLLCTLNMNLMKQLRYQCSKCIVL